MEAKEALFNTAVLLSEAESKFVARNEKRAAAGLCTPTLATPVCKTRKRTQSGSPTETYPPKRTATASSCAERHEALPPNSAFLLDKRALCPLRDFLNSTECVLNLPMDSFSILRRFLAIYPHLGIVCENNIDLIEDLIARSEFINGGRFLCLKRCVINDKERLVVEHVETEYPRRLNVRLPSEEKWSEWDTSSPHVLSVVVEKERSDLAELNQLLEKPSYKERTAAGTMKELMHMLQLPTAATKLTNEKFQHTEDCEFRQFCEYGLRAECRAKRPLNSPRCKKLHFRRIMKPQTDLDLGDCSYLNTCHRMEQCKYVHYELDEDGVVVDIERPIPLSGLGKSLPPQWIRCDVRKFDLSILGKFSVVMADPPWDIHMTLPYGTMTDDEMKMMNIASLQDDGLLFLWVTGRAMELGRDCMAIWGYKRVDELVWVKTMQLQRLIRTGRTGHWINHSKEHCLIGIKGNPKICRGLDGDVLVAEVRETSRKPDEIYGLIDRMAPGGRKIEIFGRQHNTRPGWTTLGNQLDGVRIYEKDVLHRYNQTYPEVNAKLSILPSK